MGIKNPMTYFRTSVMQDKRTGATHKTVAQWKGQRISAIALISLSIWFLIEILCHTQADYLLVLAWASQPWIGMALALFIGMVFYHSAVGLHVIIEDYIPHPFWQKTLILMVKGVNLWMALLSWFFIIRIIMMGNE